MAVLQSFWLGTRSAICKARAKRKNKQKNQLEVGESFITVLQRMVIACGYKTCNMQNPCQDKKQNRNALLIPFEIRRANRKIARLFKRAILVTACAI
jgi:hypothetical protein